MQLVVDLLLFQPQKDLEDIFMIYLLTGSSENIIASVEHSDLDLAVEL
jgi:hypothetical protein